MNKKKVFIVSLCAVVLAFVVYFVYQKSVTKEYVNTIPNVSSAKLTGDYTTEQDLLTKSGYILEGTVTNISEPFVYSRVPFVKITFQVEETLFAERSIGETVTILRESEMFTPLEKDQKYILYLYDYEGPVAENVKMVCGGNVGAMQISKKSGKQQGETLKAYKERVKNYVSENRSMKE